jgi:hypothetical protein
VSLIAWAITDPEVEMMKIANQQPRRFKWPLLMTVATLAVAAAAGAVVVSPASAITSGYNFYGFSATCTTNYNVSGQRIAGTISMTQPSVQTNLAQVVVSWQPVLERYYPGYGWYTDVNGPELRGYAGRYASALPTTSFNINVTGVYYRVRAYVRWYWNGQVFDGYWVNADGHTSVSEVDRVSEYGWGLIALYQEAVSSGSYCKM